MLQGSALGSSSNRDQFNRNYTGQQVRTARLAPGSEPAKEESAYYFLGLNLFTYKLRSHTSMIYARCFAVALKLLDAVPTLEIAEPAVTEQGLLLALVLW